MNNELLEKLGIKLADTEENYYKPLTVSQINNDIKNTLDTKYKHVIIEGEISNYKKHSSGHSYFSLIEGDALLQCISWKSVKIPALIDGMKVVCTGKITAYTGRSQFQLTIQSINISGQGNLYKLFEELKKKLQAEGLFDQNRKKTLPSYPKIVGVITGANSDAEKDILKRMEERLLFQTSIINVLVQGVNAPESIKKAIETFNNMQENRPEVIIIARGGGSIEDLAAFNDEITVRAVANSQIPTITAVGHEMDVTLVDYVSDKRAPTPTASVEILLPKITDLNQKLTQFHTRINHITKQTVQNHLDILKHMNQLKQNMLETMYENKTQKLEGLEEKLTLLLKHKLKQLHQNIPQIPELTNLVNINRDKINNLHHNLSIIQSLNLKQTKLNHIKQLLEGFAYTNVLNRGFCLAVDKNSHAITTTSQAKQETDFSLQFQDGIMEVSKKI